MFWNGFTWEREPKAPPPRRRRGGRFFAAAAEAALITTLMFGLIAGTTLAAKGGNGASGKRTASTISLVVLDGGDAVPNNGERVAFEVSTTATDRPFVGLRCWQGSAFVLDGYTGYFPDYMFDPWITLGGMYWNDALAADCTARLFWFDKRGNEKVLATLDFVAYP